MDPQRLLEYGPIIEAILSAPDEKAHVTFRGRFLIDTGTQDTMITSSAADALRLKTHDIGRMRFGTSELREFPIYRVDVSLPIRPSARFLVYAFSMPSLGSTRYSGILGRDFLRYGSLFYDGATGGLSLNLPPRRPRG